MACLKKTATQDELIIELTYICERLALACDENILTVIDDHIRSVGKGELVW